MRKLWLFTILVLIFSAELYAGKADVTDATVSCSGTCSFDVTVRHADTGWEHYAHQWQVVAEDGSVLGTRVLYHPHVNEQPFTRSLGGVKIPPHVRQVRIRAADSVHGFGGIEKQLRLPSAAD